MEKQAEVLSEKHLQTIEIDATIDFGDSWSEASSVDIDVERPTTPGNERGTESEAANEDTEPSRQGICKRVRSLAVALFVVLLITACSVWADSFLVNGTTWRPHPHEPESDMDNNNEDNDNNQEFSCVSSRSELFDAVDDYLEDRTPDSEVAKRLGWPTGSWCFSENITDMSELFSAARNPAAASFSDDISGWDTSHVVNMSQMFYHADEFNADLSAWNVESAVDLRSMFQNARSFRRDLCTWGPKLDSDTAPVFTAMFDGTNCATLEDPDLASTNFGSFCFPCV